MLNYGVRMRPSFRPAAVALVLAAALSASGCTPDASGKPPASTPSATALFASDEEALAAAEEAYRAYLAVADEILRDGGNDPDRLLQVATQEVYEKQLEGYRQTADNGWRGRGVTRLDTVSIQSYRPQSAKALVTIYACVDVAGVDVVDASGTSVVSPSRPDRTPFEAIFARSDSPPSLILSGETPWLGKDFCA